MMARNKWIQIKGKGQVMGNVRALGRFVRTETNRGVEGAGRELLKESRKIVPIETKALWHTGKVVKGLGTDPNDVKVAVQYGGAPHVHYAVFVHEDMTKRHGRVYNEYYAIDIANGELKRKRPQERAKYLSGPASDDRVQSNMLARIKNRLLQVRAKIGRRKGAW
jgi:hypothetical protein